MNKIIPFFFLDKIMPFNENLKLTHVAPKTRLLQLTNKKNWCLFSFHLGIDIITIHELSFKLMSFHFGIEKNNDNYVNPKPYHFIWTKKKCCNNCFLFWLLDFSETSWLPPPTHLTHCPSLISSQHFIFITLLSLNYSLINEYSKFIQIQFRFPFYSPNYVFNLQRQR